MITLAGGAVPPPTGINEYLDRIETDQEALDGSVQRTVVGTKKVSELEWEKLKPADYQALLGIFEPGTTISYVNDLSNRSGGVFSFTGLAKYKEGDYQRGGTLLRSFSAVIREV